MINHQSSHNYKDFNMIENINQETFRKKNIELTTQIQEAQANIAKAKADFKTKGVYADHHWFQTQRQIIRDKTAELHALNRDFKLIQSNNRDVNTMGIRFKNAAKGYLPTETFTAIEELADRHVSN